MEIAQMCENCQSRVYKQGSFIYCETKKILIWRGFYDKKCYKPTSNSHILGFYKTIIEKLPSSINCVGAMHDWLLKNGLIISESKEPDENSSDVI